MSTFNQRAKDFADEVLFESQQATPADIALYEAIDDAIMEAVVIAAMEGEFEPIEYKRMATLEADGDAIALCDYRKECRRSLMGTWFTKAQEVEDYVYDLKHPKKQPSALFNLVASFAKPVQL